MNILYITQTLPYPLYSGGHIKTYSTLILLVNKGHSVTLCTFISNQTNLRFQKEMIKKGIKIGFIITNHYITDDIGKNQKLLLFIKNIFTSIPFTAYKYCNKEFKLRINQFINNSYDCIWIDQLNMAYYLPDHFQGKTILETHNVDSLFFKRMVLVESSFLLRVFAFAEWIKYKFYENKYLSRFHNIYAISEFDKIQLEKISGRNDIKILPPKFPTKPKNITRNNTKKILLFIGSLKWYPNKDGIKWFIKKIFPEVKKSIPDIKLWIVGEYSNTFNNLMLSDITYWGFQKNIDKYFKKASIFIAPIRYGSGIRYKILESLSYNLPVISTFRGIEGLKKINNPKIIICQNKSDFIQSIIKYFS